MSTGAQPGIFPDVGTAFQNNPNRFLRRFNQGDLITFPSLIGMMKTVFFRQHLRLSPSCDKIVESTPFCVNYNYDRGLRGVIQVNDMFLALRYLPSFHALLFCFVVACLNLLHFTGTLVRIGQRGSYDPGQCIQCYNRRDKIKSKRQKHLPFKPQ